MNLKFEISLVQRRFYGNFDNPLLSRTLCFAQQVSCLTDYNVRKVVDVGQVSIQLVCRASDVMGNNHTRVEYTKRLLLPGLFL